MAIRNPNLDEEIIAYDKLQTSAINDNDEEIKTEIGTIKQSILTILAKLDLISDWVIESGSNPNGSWEKWNSGKLVQWGTTIARDISGEGINVDFPLPLDPISNEYITATLRTLNQSVTRLQIHRVISAGSGFRITVTTNGELTGVRFYFNNIGSWK